MFESWFKSNPRRYAIRAKEGRREARVFWRRLRERGGIASIGIAACFCVLLAGMFMFRKDVVAYRPGQYVPHDITARVDFMFTDMDLHNVQVAAAQSGASHVYRETPGDVWAEMREELLALPDRVHNAKASELDSPLKEILDGGAMTELEQRYSGKEKRNYDENVKRFVASAQSHLSPEDKPLVILDKKDRDNELPRNLEMNGRRKIILRAATPDGETPRNGATLAPDRVVDVMDETYSTELPGTVLTKLSDYAGNCFGVTLGPKIAHLALVKLESHPTYVLDRTATAAEQNAAGNRVDMALAKRAYYRNMMIVPAGVITQPYWEILSAENEAYHQSLTSNWLGMMQYRLGLGLMAVILTVMLSAYIVRYQPRCIRNHTRGVTMCGLLLAMLLITELAGLGSSPLFFSGMAPTILAAMILTVAYDQRFALGVATIDAVIVTMALNQDVGFFLILWTGVLTACYLLDEIRTRSKLIEVGGAAALAMIVVTAAVGAVEMEPKHFIINNCLYAGAAGLAAGFVILGILPFIEKTFRITTAMTLLELADNSQPLLRRLALEAPGTYNHSLQVATLAEAAAEAIRANSLACRVGSYYHDIGKINKPDYFVENQLGGPSRHINLTPDLSLRIIIGHVKDGVEMAKEYNLPSSLLPFINQHHGTTLVEYFYHQAQEKTGEDQPDISEYHYRYPGPKPRSKETAIVMMCDAVESATRAMAEPTAGRIEKLVRELSLKRLLDGQFEECDLTMRDLEIVERALVKTLVGIYHGRIAYPSSAPEAAKPMSGAMKTA